MPPFLQNVFRFVTEGCVFQKENQAVKGGVHDGKCSYPNIPFMISNFPKTPFKTRTRPIQWYNRAGKQHTKKHRTVQRHVEVPFELFLVFKFKANVGQLLISFSCSEAAYDLRLFVFVRQSKKSCSLERLAE